MALDKPHWKDLYTEVITSGLCTGCAACVIACPYDVLDYRTKESEYKPFHLDRDGGASNCSYGERGCTLCTRACPRFRNWEVEADAFLFGRERDPSEVSGIYQSIYLVKSKNDVEASQSQDGGFVASALNFMLRTGRIDGALVSGLKEPSLITQPIPAFAQDLASIVATSGSRYTYSSNPLGYKSIKDAGKEKLCLVGMGCQVSAPPIMAARKAGKIARRFVFTIGLMCSKTFKDNIYKELLEATYGIDTSKIKKINIKGVLQIWLNDGDYYEVPLKVAHEFTRDGCKKCPDFSAEHADISAGGIGRFNDHTLVVIRTERGKELFDSMVDADVLEVRPIDDDMDAFNLMNKLSKASRKRWISEPVYAKPALIS